MTHWICPQGPDHKFCSPISRRTQSVTSAMACPFCAGKRASRTNSLASRYPKLLKEYAANNVLKPKDVVAKSGKKVWWICRKCRHKWQTSPVARCSGEGCPKCNRGDTIDISRSKKLMALFDQTKNKSIDPKNVATGTKIWWRCPVAADHIFQCGVYRDITTQKCPYCRSYKTSASNNLAASNPALAAQWHPTKNGKLMPSDIRVTSRTPVWWKCKAGDDHEWQASTCGRAHSGMNCPFCINQRASATNNLAVMHPLIAAEFHPEKNGQIKPEDVVAGSGKVYWWRCPLGHDYKMETYFKTKMGGQCRMCKKLPTLS